MSGRRMAAVAVAAASGWLVGGTLGLVVGLAAGAAAGLRRPLLEVAAVALPIAMAIATLAEAPLDAARIVVFPLDRPISHQLGLATVIVWSVTAVRIWRAPQASEGGATAAARHDDVAPRDADDRDHRAGRMRAANLALLAVLVSTAVIGTALVLA